MRERKENKGRKMRGRKGIEEVTEEGGKMEGKKRKIR
jgi:hypothetical protein